MKRIKMIFIKKTFNKLYQKKSYMNTKGQWLI